MNADKRVEADSSKARQLRILEFVPTRWQQSSGRSGLETTMFCLVSVGVSGRGDLICVHLRNLRPDFFSVSVSLWSALLRRGI